MSRKTFSVVCLCLVNVLVGCASQIKRSEVIQEAPLLFMPEVPEMSIIPTDKIGLTGSMEYDISFEWEAPRDLKAFA
jgi:hypothetical protein